MKNKTIKKDRIKEPSKPFIFGKKNYILMIAGMVLIALGLLLMTGPDANTVNGVYDKNSWNEGIFSFRRIRLAPIVIVLGFIVEVYAILADPNKKIFGK